MVMKQEYGEKRMRRFLKYELDRYLQGRGGELVEEMPLMLVENQPYIHYRKGSLVMYALQDAIGEGNLNRAIKAYVKAVAFQHPPFTNSIEFLDYVRRAVPEERRSLVADLFERITLFDNKLVKATARKQADGRYLVKLEATARKLRADGQGNESEAVLDDWIDIGVFGEEKKEGKAEETVLFLEKRHITEKTPTVEVVVDGKPVKAGIDPYNKLVDRNSDDNRKAVSLL